MASKKPPQEAASPRKKAPRNAPPPFDWTWIDWPAAQATFAPQAPIVYVVGYGDADAAERLDSPTVLRGIAQGFGVARIVDCRAVCGGARVREGWSQGLIKEALKGGPEYEWKGGDLGGKDRFRGRGCTAEGLKWLDALATRESVMLLCACSARHACHLHRIVATDLQTREKRDAMGLTGPGPRFVHLYLDGTCVGGADLLVATDTDTMFQAFSLQIRPEYKAEAHAWQDARSSGEPIE